MKKGFYKTSDPGYLNKIAVTEAKLPDDGEPRVGGWHAHELMEIGANSAWALLPWYKKLLKSPLKLFRELIYR